MHFISASVFILSFLTLPLIFSAPTLAQVADTKTQSEKQPNEADRKKELEKKALVLLDQLVAESASFTLAENRLAVLLEASQLFWSRDEARARKLLDELKEQIVATYGQPASVFVNGFRTQTLDWLGTKNAELALDFLRSTRPPPNNERYKGYVQDDRQVESRLASTVAASNPQLAYQLAEELLKTDSRSQVVDIWRNLRGSNPELGKKLANEMIAELKSADLLKDSERFSLAINLLYQIKETSYDPVSSKDDGKGPSGISQASTDWERQAYRDLLDMIAGVFVKFMSDKSGDSADSAESDGVPGQEVLAHINNLMPEFESQLPTRAAALRGKMAPIEKIFPRPPAGQAPDFDRQIKEMEGKSVKELLNLASSVSPPLEMAVYTQAITKASEQGDLETARNIVNEHGKSSPYLKEFLNRIESQLAAKSASEGRYDEAKRTLSNLDSDVDKVSFLVQLASGSLSHKDEKAARGFLEEASAISSGSMRTKKQLSAQIAIAGGYRELDPNRSFEIMEAAIDRLNQVSAAAQEFLGFATDGNFETSIITDPVLDLVSPVAPELAQLARKDFDRATGILKRTQLAEMRVRMGLNLLFNILSDNRDMQH
jgi:hypothetical protein